MKNTRFFILCLGLLSGSFFTINFALASPADKPNVIIFVADDLGYADTGYRGSKIETPSLDRLAAEGVDIQRFYTAPMCSPTRAALMTGRNPNRLGVAYSVFLPWSSGGIHTSETFMSESFQAAGYQTAIIGKWHLGHAQQVFHPNARGFDHFYGHLHTEVGFYPPFSVLGGRDFQLNGESIIETTSSEHAGDGKNTAENYETFLLAKQASDWIENRDDDKPFFLYLPFLAPHEPLAAPDDLVEKYQSLEDKREAARSPSDSISRMAKLAGQKSRRPLYAAVVDAMDQAIGQVLDTLDQEGLTDNTIVLFFSDNGATRVFGRGGGDNYPLRGGKAETYEGGIRVVSLMRWPGKIPAGSQSSNIMTVMDVFPTLAAATGIQANNEYEFDGINMLTNLTANKTIKRDNSIFFASEIPRYGSFNFTVFDDEWKLVQWVEQDLLSTTVKNELFRVADDPGEFNNLAQQHPDIVQELSREAIRWRSLYPINGTRARISSPPGWHPPKDWASFPRPISELQDQPATSMAPSKATEYMLDFMMEDRGRLIYNCEPNRWLGGICIP
jgi:arylsulfatase A-like enzyme